jgi:hypothetical protein
MQLRSCKSGTRCHHISLVFLRRILLLHFQQVICIIPSELLYKYVTEKSNY